MTLRRLSLCLLSIIALLLTGCVAKQTKTTAFTPPPSPEQLETIRTDFKTALPIARVGVVTAVISAENYALVTQLDTAGIFPGTVISFLNADQTVIANGTVVKVDGDSLTVKFDAGRRAVLVGDAAVKF